MTRSKDSTGVVLIVGGGLEELRPSGHDALESLRAALGRAGLDSEIADIDSALIPGAVDAAFIRTYTQIGGAAHLLAKRFDAAGKPVIDRPSSIIRGCDKMHQAMVFSRAGIATPVTRLVTSVTHLDAAVRAIGGWPIVVKDPAGAFCGGVEISRNEGELAEAVATCILASGGAVLQAFMPTEFDWRIGILDGRALFAARYWMASNSWKIRQDCLGESIWGATEPVALANVPATILDTAGAAARAMGPGLWGIDVKMINGQPILIEANDNPNIDVGVEVVRGDDSVWDELARWFREAIADQHTRDGRRLQVS